MLQRQKELSQRFRRWSFLLALGLALSGCAAGVDPTPFTEFVTSIQSLRGGSDSQVGAATDASRQELLEKVASGEVSPADLTLEFDPSNSFSSSYGFAEEKPLFVELIQVRRGLAGLNEGLVSYAQSLAVLAGGGEGGDILPTTDEFAQMTRDLNGNVSEASQALGRTLDGNRQAFLSTAAVELFKTYIESQRRQALSEAITEVQPEVESVSQAAQQAIRLLATLVQKEYTLQVLPLATATPPNAEPILVLNDTTQTTLATLEALWRSYGNLPSAHRDLAAAATKEETGLAGLVAFGTETARLNTLLGELQAANQTSDTPSQ